jgi:oleandomycin transport system permease protein
VPASSTPGWLQALVKVNPVTVVTNAARGLMIAGPVAKPLLESAAWLAAITVTSWALNVQRYPARV